MNPTISGTEFSFSGQTAHYRGKVRDTYTINDKYLVAVASDRVSAFDVILPRAIPYKGQILNQLGAYFLEASKGIMGNWLIDVPDPNVSIGYLCKPVKIEMVVRGNLVGHSWRVYKDGGREMCGVRMPEGLKEYDAFPKPIITPTTKTDGGHDLDLTPSEILEQGLATAQEFDRLCELSLKLFAHGQEMAKKRGMILTDTKYEFGYRDENLYVIDEIHTPDSSRYFYADSYQDFLQDRSKPKPRHLSKEFVREWLMKRGFSGQPGEEIPELNDKFVNEVSDRYVELYEKMTGKKFKKIKLSDKPEQRIESNVKQALKKLAKS